MILGQTRSARLGCRFAQACGCFQPVGRVKNRGGRLASSTGKSRARQGAGQPDGHGSGSARCQSFGAQRTPLTRVR